MSIIEKSFRNGEVMIKEGDTGRTFFRIIEGSAFVFSNLEKKDQMKLGELQEGEYFGEMAILEDYPRSASVVAKGNVRLIEIPESDMNAYFAEDPERFVDLVKHIGNRIRTMTGDYGEAKALLDELRRSDSARKDKSLFSRIKKHIDIYQAGRNDLTRPNAEAYSEAFARLTGLCDGGIKSYRKGMFVYREKDADENLYILHSGNVSLYGNYRTNDEYMISEITPIAVVGEMCSDPRSATAVVESDDTTVEIIRDDYLKEIFSSCSEKADLILRLLSCRLRFLNIDFLNTCKEIKEDYESN